MVKLRVFISWCFCDLSVILVAAAVSTARSEIHSQAHFEVFRTTIVPLLFLVVACVYGTAWWTIWKRTRSGREWGIAASLISMLVWVSISRFAWHMVERWFISVLWVPTLLGVVGIIAFSTPSRTDVVGATER